ncbi:riboflavin-specific deaminase-like protein [Obelidium mucronatum]|nr:riboflavin-specific deaminase-like protein [Obelidium mucronatum]
MDFVDPLLAADFSGFDFDGAPRPFVVLSFAQSLDACIGARDAATPLLLSGAASLAMTHAVRARVDGVLVGSGTLAADDPRLTVRAEYKQPRPVVLDARLRTRPEANIVRLGHRPIVVCDHAHAAPSERRRALEAAGVEVAAVASVRDLAAVLRVLKARFGLRAVMVEGGSAVIASFLAAGKSAVDRLIITIAPVVVGPSGVKAFQRRR